MNAFKAGFLGALALTALVRLSAGAETAPNHLANPGFELVDAANGNPQNWGVPASNAGLVSELDTKTFRSGKRSLHFAVKPPADAKSGGSVMVLTMVPPRYLPGHTYTFSCHVKAQDLKGVASLALYEYPAPMPPSAMHDSKQTVSGTADWTRLSITFTARPEIYVLQLRLLVAGTGSQPLQGDVWFDDAKLEEGDAPTAFVDDWEKEFYTRGGTVPAFFPLTYDYRPSMAMVTPYAAPSRPAACAKPKVLFVLGYGLMRLPVELAQRADMEMDAVAINARFDGKIFLESIQVMKERLKALDPGVVVMDVGVWHLLISSDRRALLDRVKDGKGMVFDDLDGAPRPELKEALDQAEPAKDGVGKAVEVAPGVSFFRCGAGRLAVVSRRPPPDSTYLREMLHDRVVRAIQAVNGFLPRPLAVTVEPAIPQAGQPWKVQCAWGDGPSQPPANLRLRLRPNIAGSEMRLVFQPAEALAEQTARPESEKGAVFAMAPLAAGNYTLEVSALDAKGAALGWAFVPMACDAPSRVWDVEVPEPLAPGRPLQATVRVDHRSKENREAMLQGELRDTENRLLGVLPARSVLLKPGLNAFPVTLKIAAAVTPQARLRVELIEAGRKVDSRDLPISAEGMLREPDFRLMFYSDFNQGMQSLGADTAVVGPWQCRPAYGIPDTGLRLYPWIDVMPKGEKTPWLEPSDSVTSPETRKKISAAVRKLLADCQPYRTVGMIIQDEWSYQFKKPQEASDTAYFHDYLRKVYGKVEELNRSWGTRLGSFDEVTLDLADEEKLRDGKANPAPWADRRRMVEVAVAEYLQVLADAAKSADPSARIGLSGTYNTSADNGFDWWLMMKSMGAIAAYGGAHNHMQESWMGEGHLLSQWSYPSQNNITRGRLDPWAHLLRQLGGYLHYGGGYTELFTPCYQPYPAGKAIAEEIEAMRNGPARVIRTSRREDFGIAILSSMASYHASRLAAIAKTGPDLMNDIVTSLDTVLPDVGMDSHFVSTEQLVRGELRPETTKVLFLPYALALSAEEAAAVRKYAEQGGLVIADLRPAVFDEHCHPLGKGALDDVFGIEPPSSKSALAPAKLAAGKDLTGVAEAAVTAGEWDLRLAAGSSALAGISAEGKQAPAIVVHPVGKGRAVLLNFAFPDYLKYRAAGYGGEEGVTKESTGAKPVKSYLLAILQRYAGLQPPVRVTNEKGEDMPFVRIYHYRDGPLAYFGFVPRYGKYGPDMAKYPGKLTVRGTGELYDARAGKYLGKTGESPITVQEATGYLYSVLPYRVTKVAIECPGRVDLGDDLAFSARVETSGGAPGRHVLVARFTRPNGASRAWDRFTFLAPGGAGKAGQSFALDDPAGDWTLTVTDAATGVSASAKIAVRGAPPPAK